MPRRWVWSRAIGVASITGSSRASTSRPYFLTTLLWTDGLSSLPCDCRLYEPAEEGKEQVTENDHFLAMLQTAKEREFRPRYVCFDGWYSSLANLKAVRGLASRPRCIGHRRADTLARRKEEYRKRECLFAIGRPQQPSEGVNSSRSISVLRTKESLPDERNSAESLPCSCSYVRRTPMQREEFTPSRFARRRSRPIFGTPQKTVRLTAFETSRTSYFGPSVKRSITDPSGLRTVPVTRGPSTSRRTAW